MPELSAPLTQQLSHVLDCTVTLRRGVDDRSTEVTIMVTTAWDATDVDHADRGLLAPQVRGEPDEEGWLNAQVAALHGYLFDLSEPDVMDQADEISALCVAIIACLHPDGDTVLALETADWFPPFDSVALVRAGLNVIDRVVSRLCDRMAYGLGDHLRLVETDDCEPPVVEHPQSWWLARGWRNLGDELVVRPCDS